ncbi:MAG: MoaD/ThiS family protein, partial [Paracoccaceae bacterium]
MKIILNGAPHEARGQTLADLVDEMGLGDAKVATAVNEDFVPATARTATRLSEG